MHCISSPLLQQQYTPLNVTERQIKGKIKVYKGKRRLIQAEARTMPPPSLILILWCCIDWKIVPSFVLTTPRPVLSQVVGLRNCLKIKFLCINPFLGLNFWPSSLSCTGPDDFLRDWDTSCGPRSGACYLLK